MVDRSEYLDRIDELLGIFPVVAIHGPRQCGKTTLARVYSEHAGHCVFYDLEDPTDRARLSGPMLELERQEGLVILDEIQRKPELFEILRVLSDRPDAPARFLVLGSASPHLVRGVSETLAGRIGFLDLSGFGLQELGNHVFRELWVRGGFPRSYLATSQTASYLWRRNFVRTFLERDVVQLGFSIPSESLRRFWTMLAHYHAQVWNAAEFARSLGSSETTARRYLELLEGAFVVRRLLPWHENLKKRQVKSPKVYVRDSGILHALLGLESEDELLGHPKVGASWEGFVVEQVIQALGTRDVYYWRTQAGAELDLLYFLGGKRYGIEIKYGDAPTTTKSMRVAVSDLKLEFLAVVHPGAEAYLLDSNIAALPLRQLDAQTLRDPLFRLCRTC